MTRRAFITLLGGAAAVAARGARAAAERCTAIGVLMPGRGRSGTAARYRGVPARLARTWLDDGRSMRLDIRWGKDDAERLSQIRSGTGRARADVILAQREYERSERCHEATRTVPIVFAVVVDPVGTGFVESLARPGGNVTGLTCYSTTYRAGNGWSCSKRSRQAYARGGPLESAQPSRSWSFEAIQAAAPSLWGRAARSRCARGRRFERAFAAMCESASRMAV